MRWRWIGGAVLLSLLGGACAEDKSSLVESEAERLSHFNSIPSPDYVINASRLGQVQWAVVGQRTILEQPLVIPNGYSRPVSCQAVPPAERPKCAAYKNYLRERAALALLRQPLLSENQNLAYPTRLEFRYAAPLGILEEVRIYGEEKVVQQLGFPEERQPESFSLADFFAAGSDHNLMAAAAAGDDEKLAAFISQIADRDVTLVRGDRDRRLTAKTDGDLLKIEESAQGSLRQFTVAGAIYRRTAKTNSAAVIRQEVLQNFPSTEESQGTGVIRFSLAAADSQETYRVDTRHPVTTPLGNPYAGKIRDDLQLKVIGNHLVLKDGKNTVADQVVVRKAEKMPLDEFLAVNRLKLQRD